MRAKSVMLLAFVGGISCAGGLAAPPQAPAGVAKPGSPPAVAAAPAASSAALAETLSEADQAYVSQLSATRGGQFAVDRQVWVLQQAILLYTEFLDRAQGRPEFEPAIKKSRERIADCQATIAFLLASSSDAPPPASTP